MSQANYVNKKVRGIMSGGANDWEYIEGGLRASCLLVVRGVDDGIFPTKHG